MARKVVEKEDSGESNRDNMEVHDSEHDDHSPRMYTELYNSISWTQCSLQLSSINMSYCGVLGKRQGKIGKSQSQDESSEEHHGSFPSSSAHSHQSLRYAFSLPALSRSALLCP